MRTTYRDALSFIYSYTDYEQRGFATYAPEFYDLDRVRRLLAALGNPQDTFRIVHIAGTKGKGSTAAMAESILRAAGYRTGLFTSPHLHTFRERMQICGDPIAEAGVVRLVRMLRPRVRRIPGITTFEIMTTLALAWFAEEHTQWVVLEVGLGGRLDATNVVSPAVSVITPISLDHTAILGDTVAKIAAEKAGIVKPGVPAVSAPQPPEAASVIEETCRRLGVPLTTVGHDYTWTAGPSDLRGQTFSVGHGRETLSDLWIPLLGEHQQVNATTALATIDVLRASGLQVPPEAPRAGLRDVRWPARLEILSDRPLLVVDSAHNGDSAEKLVKWLSSLDANRLRTMVVGVSADHVTSDLLRTLLSGAQRCIATRSRHPRAADPAALREQAMSLGLQMEVCEGVPAALDSALAQAGPESVICCAGSVFVAAEARAAWFAREGLPLPPSDPV
jgi:dihydrofolate synthase / folylpolyglutamate synthase